jgi:hypothetical protein
MVKVYTKTNRQSDSRDLVTVEGIKTPINAVARSLSDIVRFSLHLLHRFFFVYSVHCIKPVYARSVEELCCSLLCNEH